MHAMTHPSSRHRSVLLLALTLLTIAPVWAFRYFPTTDGPSHLENAYILRHWFDQDQRYAGIYEINPEPVPNWFTHGALALFMVAVPPLVAEKVLVTFLILALVVSMGILLRAMGRDHLFHLLLAFPLLYNFLLFMGFYNYMFSLAVMFFILGTWWRRRHQPLRWKFLLGLNLLFIFLYFCHIVSTVLALASVLLLSALRDRLRLRRTLALALGLVPALVLPCYYLVSRGFHPFGDQPPANWKHLFGLSVLISHDLRSAHIGTALGVLFAVLCLHTLLRRRPFLRIEPGDGFAVLAFVFALLYFLMPQNVSGGGYMRERLGLLPFLTILPWLTVKYWKPLKLLVGATAVSLTLLHLAFTTSRFGELNDRLDDFTTGIPHVEKNKTLLAMNFFEHVGVKKTRICTFLHAIGYYGIATGAIGLDNYEANTDHFPLKYRRDRNPFLFIGPVEAPSGDIHPEAYPLPVDYILIRYPRDRLSDLHRFLRGHRAVRWIMAHYEPVCEKGFVWLLRRGEARWPP